MDDTDKTVVVDASIFLAWLLPKEVYHLSADHLLSLYSQKVIQLDTPVLCIYEIINGLKSAILRKRIKVNEAITFLKEFSDLKINESFSEKSRLLKLSHDLGISVYDAAYIELYQRKKCIFCTADKKLFTRLKLSKLDNILWIEEIEKLDYNSLQIR